jgi:protein-disulfide isomerase
VTSDGSRNAANAISFVSAAGLLGVTIWAAGATPPPRAAAAPAAVSAGVPVTLRDAPALGSAQAPVALIVFSDFECPYCWQLAQKTLPSIRRTFVDSGQLLLAFRHLPLESIHSEARRAAEAAECARARGRFWELHDAIFEDRPGLQAGWLERAAARAGLPPAFAGECAPREMQARVQSDIAAADALAIGATPTLLLGPVDRAGRMTVARTLSGAVPPDRLASEIQGLLDQSRSR